MPTNEQRDAVVAVIRNSNFYSNLRPPLLLPSNTLPRPNKLLLNVRKGGQGDRLLRSEVRVMNGTYNFRDRPPSPPHPATFSHDRYPYLLPRVTMPVYQYKTSLYCLVETIQIRTRAEPGGTANTSRDDNRLARCSILSIVYYYIFDEHNSALIKNNTTILLLYKINTATR